MIKKEVIDNSEELLVDEEISEPTIEEQLAKVEALAKENERRYLYLAAEFDNYRKRSERDMNKYKVYKNKDIILSMLDIIDDFERALNIDKDNQGLTIIYNKFKKILEDDGLSEINIEIGQPFDDEYMNCVYISPTTVDSLHNTVANISRKGYMYKDDILRYSDVITYNKTN